MEPKKNTAATVALLSAGICLAIPLAIWNIKRAISPPSSTPKAPPALHQPAETATTTTTETAQAASAASPQPAAGDELLALAANPFAPLPILMTKAPQASAALAPRPQHIAHMPATPLLPFPAMATTPLPPRGGTTTVHAAPPEPTPELAGTFLGARACAVFNVNRQLVTVPVGGKMGSWRVMSVTHGRVLLRAGRRTAFLTVGGNHLAGGRGAVETPRTADTETKTPQQSVDATPQQPVKQTPPEETPKLPETDPLPAGNPGEENAETPTPGLG